MKTKIGRRNFLAVAGAGTLGALIAGGAEQASGNPGAAKTPTPCCVGAPKLIFPCSGSSDVGGLADQAARKMTRDATGKMYCLAAIGAHIPSFVESTKLATKVLVIDGCPEECARKTLEQAGIKSFSHLKLADMGFQKGATPASAKRIRQVAEAGAGLLAG
jgi:uncharacterized metal-binding protein